MAYIGKTPTIGNFQVCDAISVVNGQAAYTMQVNSVNVSPESANHMLVSLNGILQKAGSSFTVSGSTITFASNLVTGDVIDFIQILGNVLDLGVPSDATVSLAKLTATGTKDATTFLRGDNTFASVTSPDYVKLATGTVSAQSTVSIDGYYTTDYNMYKLYMMGVHQNATSQDLFARVNIGGSAQSDTSYAFAYRYQGVNSSGANNVGDSGGWSSNAVTITNNMSSSVQYSSILDITIFDPLSTTARKNYTYHNMSNYNNDGGILNQMGGFQYRGNTSAHSGLSFFAGNSQTTTIEHWVLYGLKI
nr:hypothetical protein [uncultured Mediterranean phage uvMED]